MSDNLITYDDFAKLELCSATILSAEAHPNADRLLVLKVDVGEKEPRQIVAGIAKHFNKDDLVGQKIVVLLNILPVTLRGVASNGMLLAAGEPLSLVTVNAVPGARVG